MILLRLPVALLLGLAILACNVVQMFSIPLYVLYRPLFRRYNEGVSNAWWWLMYNALTKVLGNEIRISGLESLPEKENAIVLSNHQGMVDILCINAIATLKGSGGYVKFFTKDPIKWVPGVGWGMHFLNYIFLKREWTRDADSILKTFATIRNEKIPFFLVSFPEGTRATAQKLALSQAYARSQGLPVLQRCMVPRTKGVVSTVQGLDGAFGALYDITIAYEGHKAPGLMQYFLHSQKPVRVIVERIPAASLPKAPEELAKWLHERFQKKDTLLAKL